VDAALDLRDNKQTSDRCGMIIVPLVKPKQAKKEKKELDDAI
jgi:hypothetical protein